MAEPRRLTVMLSGGLGDCLLASAFVRHFDQSGRYDRIVCALPAQAAQLYDRNPRVSQLVPCAGPDLWLWGLPGGHGDVFAPYARVTPKGNSDGRIRVRIEKKLPDPNQKAEPVWRQVAALQGISMEDGTPELVTSPADEAWADQVAAEWRGRKSVLISYRSAHVEKEYPLARWQSVVDALRGEAVILELGDDDSPLEGTKRIAPMPGLRQSAALARRCDCVVAIDSFALHLAAAAGTRAVGVFGPTNPAVWGHPTTTCIRATECPVCADTPRLRQCGRRQCMEVPPEAVASAARGILGSGRQL